jgi:putative flippase GtrA
MNALVDYSVLWVGQQRLCLRAPTANASGYAAALCAVYFLNRVLVFNAFPAGGASVICIMFSFILAFVISQGALTACIEFFKYRTKFAEASPYLLRINTAFSDDFILSSRRKALRDKYALPFWH